MPDVMISYVISGQRRTIHQVAVVDGVRHAGTERCNIDDSRYQIKREDDLVAARHLGKKMCRWCFPV